jgi:hypothetical protein
MDDYRQGETARERRAWELSGRLFSYAYLKEHGLLRDLPQRHTQRGPDRDPPTRTDRGPSSPLVPREPPDDGGGHPYAGAMAMPVPEDESDRFRSYPATVIPAVRQARQ